jgi:cysteine desulfuration protein SufE
VTAATHEPLPAAWLAACPYGTRVTAADIEATLSLFDDWQERYRYLIDLGRDLPAMPASLRTDERLIRGCQSRVWLAHDVHDGHLRFVMDSDAHIVRGLIAVVLCLVQGRTPADIARADIEAFFARIDLLGHLSPTRGNGLRALVARIRDIADAVG